MKNILFILLTSLILLSACSIKKRNYRNGYYIDWVHKNLKKTANKTNVVEKDNVNPQIILPIPPLPSVELATTNNKLSEKIIIPKKYFLANDTCDDVINLRDGSFLKAKVIEITDTQIKYKRCDNIDGPLIVVNKNDVYSIKYTNGVTDNFIKMPEITANTYPNKRERPNNRGNETKIVHPLAWIILALTISIFITSFLGILAVYLLAPIAKQRILEQANKYSGLDIINACLTAIRILMLIALVIILIVFLLALGII